MSAPYPEFPKKKASLQPGPVSWRIAQEWGLFLQTVGGGTAVQERATEPDAGGAAEQDRGLADGSTLCERRLSGCSLCGIEEEHRAVYDMVQRILLSTRGYPVPPSGAQVPTMPF